MGSSSISSEKPHAVLIPYPAQGHINPLMQLAKLLHSKGFHITFVNNEFNHQRLIKSKSVELIKELDGFKFESIPDGLPPSDPDATQDVPSLSYSIHHNVLKQPFIELLQRLNSSQDVPPVSVVIPDAIMNFANDAAEELGIPSALMWTASACGFLGHLKYFELAKQGVLPFKDENFLTDGTLDAPVEWVPGVPKMKLKDLPSFMRITNLDDIMFNYLGSASQKSLKSSALLFNTFYDYEEDALEAIKKMHPNIYTAGPLSLLLDNIPGPKTGSINPSLWKEDTYCLEWLDKQSSESVVYVNYGSITVMSDQHFKEFAWGLANSMHPFLWIVRPDVVKGDSKTLSKEFYDEIKDRGLIVSWCPQAKVLKHPSIGAYLSHCGWNSISESVVGGVPLLCWPFFAEQQTNCRYACTVWGTGMEVNNDVKREELAELVREMMESEKGKELRNKAKEWRKKAEVATSVGGSAYNEFERFVKEALH